jgi:hypothetical protein
MLSDDLDEIAEFLSAKNAAPTLPRRMRGWKRLRRYAY